MQNSSRILIVDDSLPARQNLRKILVEMGYRNLDEAADGELALNALRDAQKDGKPFALVISDVWMPNMDGIAFLKLVRSETPIKNTPFLMITTENNKPYVIQAVMSGISGYIVKPYTAEEVRIKIDEIFRRASEFSSSSA